MKVVAVGNTVLFLDMASGKDVNQWVEVARVELPTEFGSPQDVADELDESFQRRMPMRDLRKERMRIQRIRESDGLLRTFLDSEEGEAFQRYMLMWGKKVEDATLSDLEKWKNSKQYEEFLAGEEPKKEDKS